MTAAGPGLAFGRATRRLRRARGWTLTRLAAEAGLSLASISSIETGRYTPGLGAAWRIAAALEASLDTMCADDTGQPAPGTPAACRHCRRPIIACNTQPPHSGCGSGYGWIHAEPHWGHSCQTRAGTVYARPAEAS